MTNGPRGQKHFADAALLAAALAAAPALARAATAPDGKTVYAGYCQACHQAAGQGMKPVFPALAGSAIVNGPPGPAIDRVLNGKSSMPPFKGQLDDGQIAAVVTYVRAAFGNHAGPVTPAEVAAAQKAH
jgi:cytochrome c oxidase subunit 2